MISAEDKERVREAVDFVSLVAETVVLKERSSGDFWGCCPFHQEKSPSFHVQSSTGLWHCFGCGEGGDIFSYVQKRDNVSFPEAIRMLAERGGVEIEDDTAASSGPKRSRLEAVLTEARDFYAFQVMRVRGPGQDRARAYLAGRGFNGDVCRRWGLGYAPGRGALVSHLLGKGFSREELLTADLAVVRDGRLADRFYERAMFPICNERGAVIGLGGRVMGDGKPKYLNSKDSPVWHKSKNLFAYDRAKEGIVATGEAIVVEGYTDAISLHEAGFTNVVAVLGTALTADHMKLLGRLKPQRIVMMLDGDEAGQRAAEKAVRFLATSEAELMSVVLPGGKDPAEFLEAEGADGLRAQLAAARPLVDFVLEKSLEGLSVASPGVRGRVLDHLARVLAPLKGTYFLDDYAVLVADRLGVTQERVLQAVRAAEPLAEEAPNRPMPVSRPSRPEPEPDYADYGPADEYGAYPDASADGGGWSFEGAPAPSHATAQPSWQNPAPASSGGKRAELERELVCLMADHPALMAPFGERVAQVSWSDPMLQSIAWTLMMQPPDTPPAKAVLAAEEAVPGAVEVLSSGRLGAAGEPTEREVGLLLDSLEYQAARERLPEIRALLDSWPDRPDAADLFAESQSLKDRVRELQDSFAARG